MSFIFKTKDSSVDLARFNAALDSLLFLPSYSRRLLDVGDRFVLESTCYPDYPIDTVKVGDRVVVIEGRIIGFNGNALTDKIGSLASSVFDDDSDEALRSWLLNSDGEFLIYLRDKGSDEFVILSDALGRLPCYFSGQDGSLLLSREFSLFASLPEYREYDRMGISQFLLFGYPLSDRTFLKGVQRLPPSFLLRISKGSVSMKRTHTFNLDRKEHADRTADENATKLAKLFRDSCNLRSRSSAHNLVSLSGGMDSRTVAAGLQTVNANFVTVSFGELGSREMKLASQVAQRCAWPWEHYLLRSPIGRDVLELLNIKGGLNSLEMAFIIPFLQRLSVKYGQNSTYFTGDWGDKSLPDLRPVFQPNNTEQLISTIVKSQQKSSMKFVTSLTGIDPLDIRREVEAVVRAYPEEELCQKYVHFLIYERGMRWLSEGEDRNRYYFWSSAPLIGIHFFTYAMNCPDEQKRNYVLYRKFLSNLSRCATEVADSKDHSAPASRRFGIIRQARIILDQEIPLTIKNRFQRVGSLNDTSPIRDCLQKQAAQSQGLTNGFRREVLLKVIDDWPKYTRNDLLHLFTAISFIESVEIHRSSILQYSDRSFA